MIEFSSENLEGLVGQYVWLRTTVGSHQQTGRISDGLSLRGIKTLIDTPTINIGNYGVWVPDQDDSEFERII